jgi:hypothetical protein
MSWKVAFALFVALVAGLLYYIWKSFGEPPPPPMPPSGKPRVY